MSGAVDSAVRLAAMRPDSTLPCPLCAAEVRGVNLDRHLNTVHPATPRPTGGPWRGPERLVVRALVGVLILVVLAGVAVLLLTDLDRWAFVGLGVTVGGGMILIAVASGTRLFRGRLSAHGDGLVLRHTLGLGRRRLARVDRVVTGSAYDRNSGPDGITSDTGAGIYLDLRCGRRRIIVRCPQSAGFRRTWTGWEQGARSRRWHITLAPADFVALQYTLAELGVLRPR